MERNGEQYIQSLARGLSVIRTFSLDASSLTITEVAKRTGLTRAGARRILLTLQTLGYVRAEDRRFSLTARVLDLGYAYLSSLPFWDFAQPIIEDLVASVHETSSIAVLDGADIVFVVRVPTRRLLRTQLSIGSRIPAYAHSMGRILLGSLTIEELGRYLDTAKLLPFTKRTVVAPARLRKIVADGRRKGWIWVNGELEEGACGISVPLIASNGKIIAAMNIVLNTGRSSESKAIKTFLPQLQAAAEKIKSALLVRRG